MADTPTVRKRRLGRVLRELREKAKLTNDQAAAEIGFSTAKVSRMETGHNKIVWRDVRDLVDIYGGDAELKERIHDMVKECDQEGYWEDFEDVMPKGFETYVSMESEAAVISTFQTSLVHGLLQTPAYARALLRDEGVYQDEEEIERVIQLRLARQELLTREENPLRLWCILDEAVLRRSIGGPDVMREQLEHLVEMSRRENVEIQVLPFAVGAHAGISGAYTIVEFAEPADPDLAYIDCAAGNIYVENPERVRRLKTRFSHVVTEALKPKASVTLIRKIARE